MMMRISWNVRLGKHTKKEDDEKEEQKKDDVDEKEQNSDLSEPVSYIPW